jgi:hypothetical protein
MSEKLTNDAKVEICRADFYLMLQNAMLQAGGGMNVERLKLMPLHEVVMMLAQNGIRMVYMEDRHMDSLSIEWKAKPSDRREDGPLPKKSLLTDRTIRSSEMDDGGGLLGRQVVGDRGYMLDGKGEISPV